jgi:hypothetical protein
MNLNKKTQISLNFNRAMEFLQGLDENTLN